jgi:hypothetical protein
MLKHFAEAANSHLGLLLENGQQNKEQVIVTVCLCSNVTSLDRSRQVLVGLDRSWHVLAGFQRAYDYILDLEQIMFYFDYFERTDYKTKNR